MVFTLYWLFGLLFNRKTSVSGLVNIQHKPCPLQWRVVNYYLLVLQWCHTDWLKPECNYFILSVLLRKDSVSEIFFFSGKWSKWKGIYKSDPITVQTMRSAERSFLKGCSNLSAVSPILSRPICFGTLPW